MFKCYERNKQWDMKEDNWKWEKGKGRLTLCGPGSFFEENWRFRAQNRASQEQAAAAKAVRWEPRKKA